MKKLFVLFIALVVLLTAAAAQAESRISVSGTGEIRVSADTAVISLGVNARDKDVLKAQQKVNESIAAIRAALTEQGISEEFWLVDLKDTFDRLGEITGETVGENLIDEIFDKFCMGK